MSFEMQIDPFPAALHPVPRQDAAKIDQVARQLEGQFAQLLIKSMRDASFGDALFPGENQLFRDMHDQQLAKALTHGKGLGIAAMVARQLGRTGPQTPGAETILPAAQNTTANHHLARSAAGSAAAAAPTPEGFVAQIWQHAQQAARELGVNARALVAQAALETGWGQHGIQHQNGRQSHNLFGIKATHWQGKHATAVTHEYHNGVRRAEQADFRAYSSVAESFADYVRMLKNNPRYRQALQAGDNIHGFAAGLQKAGYATDPHYAKKISAIANGPVLKQILAKVTGAVRP